MCGSCAVMQSNTTCLSEIEKHIEINTLMGFCMQFVKAIAVLKHDPSLMV